MKTILLLLGLSISTFSQAQVWANPGAIWHYDFGLFWGGLYTIEYVGDTTILGYDAQRMHALRQTIYPQQNGTTVIGETYTHDYFTRHSGDSVFWYSENQFFLLYDFGAAPGDTWTIQQTSNPDFMCDSNAIVEVVDTGSVQINGMNLRYIDMRYVQGGLGMSGRAVERIGMVDPYNPEISFLFPRGQNCDSTIVVDFWLYNLRCYEDDNFAVYNRTSQTCDYPVATASLSETTEIEKKALKFYDLLGREVEHPNNQLVIILFSDGTTEKRYVD
ncbi:MAG: hypothetical protein ACFHU9_16580 [Fluviicola sp.]